MVRRFGTRWLWTTLIALGLSLGVTAFCQVTTQEPLLWARNVPGDSRPIQVTADDAVTWVEQGKRILLLKGKVWVEQGDANFRASQAVIWLPDDTAQKMTGIYHLELYSDDGVSLEIGAQNYQAPVGMIELNTRGSVNVKTFKNKIAKTASPQDPLFQRAIAAMTGQAKPTQPSAATKSPIQQVAKRDGLPTPPSVADVPSEIKQAFAAPPAPQQTASSAPGSIQQVQAQNPPPAQGAQVIQPPPAVITPPSFGGPPGSPPKAKPPVVVPPPGAVTPFEGTKPQFTVRQRSSEPFKVQPISMQNGETAMVISPGVIIEIIEPPANGDGTPRIFELGADRAVIWTKGDVKDLVEGTAADRNQAARQLEFYLSGNVEIRYSEQKKTGAEPKIMRCKEAYYDIGRNVAIVLDADLEVRQPGLPNPIHVQVPVLHQLNANLFEFATSMVNASTLPYGPGLYLTTGQATLEDKKLEKKTIFGQQFYNRETGEVEYAEQLLFRGRNVTLWLEGIPIFWLPYLQGDARDPLGPLESISVGYSKAFGFTVLTSFDVFNLIGLDPIPGIRWRVNPDIFFDRGPALGTDIGAVGNQLAGISGRYSIGIKAMGMYDQGTDLLGGDRGTAVKFGSPLVTLPITHPDFRGRFLGELNWQDMPYNLTVQAKVAAISDRNFLDQYYNLEWLNGPNQETFLYVKQQQDNWALTGLVEPRIRNWITEGQWLPKVEGHWIGQDLLQYFTYTTRASAGYGHLLPTSQPPPAYGPTDVNVATGRFDWWNELALPIPLGPFKVVPYGVVDLTYYTQTIPGGDEGRFYGGGGVRGSLPLSQLYAEAQSELFNVNGIYHKMVFGGNYYWAHSDRSHLLFPQLDRLNDDASDQALRDIFPQQATLNPMNAAMLTSGFFDPQLYAIRKLVLDKVDTLDSIEVVQLDWRQRWQTKRGFPGQQHIIDWMTLDLSASLFPQSDRDNFGELANFLEYDWSWNIGDRFTLFSSGWFDPHEGGARVWSFGTQMNRPDRSSLYLGYRQIDPLESKQIIASVGVPFSQKYSLAASTSYDFGVNTQVNSLAFTRTGTDLMVTLGFSYNTILNNFGVIFEITPNLLPGTRRVPGIGNYMTTALRQGS